MLTSRTSKLLDVTIIISVGHWVWHLRNDMLMSPFWIKDFIEIYPSISKSLAVCFSIEIEDWQLWVKNTFPPNEKWLKKDIYLHLWGFFSLFSSIPVIVDQIAIISHVFYWCRFRWEWPTDMMRYHTAGLKLLLRCWNHFFLPYPS